MVVLPSKNAGCSSNAGFGAKGPKPQMLNQGVGFVPAGRVGFDEVFIADPI